MDTEDHTRISRHLAKLLDELKRRRVMTNTEVRACAGTRGMGRINDLIRKHHEPITVRKLKGGLWECRYDMPALGRDAGSRKPTRRRVSPQTESLFTL